MLIYKFKNDFEIKPENFENVNWNSANGFCFDEEGKVAIVWEDEKGYWNLPGGGKENGESPEQTFVREVVEEAQALPYEIKFFHSVYAKAYDENGVEVPVRENRICFRYICKLKNIQEFVPNKISENFTSEIDDRKFVTLEELPEYITWLKDTENGKDSFEILKKMLNS